VLEIDRAASLDENRISRKGDEQGQGRQRWAPCSPRPRRTDLHPGGMFRVKLGDVIVDAPFGSCVFIPRETPHTRQNVGDTPGRFFAIVMPAAIGFEQLFMRYAALPSHERGPEAFARLGIETSALEVVGPPMAQSDPI
jgi:hypothetical protein